MKIGRNAPCPCGSGKKYKRCHGDLSKSPPTQRPLPGIGRSIDRELQKRGEQMFDAHKAAEKVRKQQQGFGKPIISAEESNGYRIVGVGSTIYWSKDWIVFPDFLLYFLKKTLGFEWGAREQQTNSAHPLFRWLEKYKAYMGSQSASPGRVKTGPMVGYIASILHLAYALYLIGHHDKIPSRLARRLRDPATFMPSFYETLVGAALAAAGFEIANAETKATSQSTPEFRARSKRSGKTYEVEAKRKERWTSPTDDVNAESFRRELEQYVRGRIYNASRKNLRNPIFWIELSMPRPMSEADWRAIAEQTKSIVSDAEKMTIDGAPIAPAFVILTSHTYLANEDAAGDAAYAFIEPLGIPDYPFDRTMEIEALLEGYDKYRDIFWMMDAWKVARTIPITFDGSPPELLSPDGQPQKILQIGDVIVVPDEHGNEVTVQVEEIISAGDKATLAVRDPVSSKRSLLHYTLTEGEAKAAALYTDAIFGKPKASHELRGDDPFDLYNWLLGAYAETTPDQLERLFRENGMLERYQGLSPLDARVRLAREYTKAMWTQTKAKQRPPPPTQP
jgi:SEC-C motif